MHALAREGSDAVTLLRARASRRAVMSKKDANDALRMRRSAFGAKMHAFLRTSTPLVMGSAASDTNGAFTVLPRMRACLKTVVTSYCETIDEYGR